MRKSLFSDLSDAFHDQEIANILSSEHLQCMVLEDEHQHVLGFIELSLRNVVDGCLGGPVGYIEGLFVRAKHRGCGLGTLMVRQAVKWLRSSGCRQIATDAEIGNPQAQAFYKRFGFTERWHVVQFTMNIEDDPSV